jgi:ribonuclease HII
MDELDRRFPVYGFGSHRGYATPEHLSALRRHGPCREHRLTFDRVVVSRGAAKAA